MNRRILLVDDDVKTVDLLRLYLIKDSYRVLTAHDGLTALEMARQKRPDLIVLDGMLPGMDGLDVCRILRAESKIPIIMLTARATEDDMLRGLDYGADDYLAKPFSPRELLARVRTVLRRYAHQEEEERQAQIVRFGEIEINFTSYEVMVRGEAVRLTPKEFKLLELLVNEPGRAFSRTELVEKVFGFDYDGLERTVDVHMMNLRKKLEPDAETPAYFQTVYGIGYKFVGKRETAVK